jgi:hypothetical protein
MHPPGPQNASPDGGPLDRPGLCPCGRHLPAIAGLCTPCYERRRRSRRRFGGQREIVLARDGHCCRVCAAPCRIVVHHRRPGNHDPDWLTTLCAACHAAVHRTLALRKWLPPLLLLLWEEQHPGRPVQLQFGLEEV